jgi:hypothetical protein
MGYFPTKPMRESLWLCTNTRTLNNDNKRVIFFKGKEYLFQQETDEFGTPRRHYTIDEENDKHYVGDYTCEDGQVFLQENNYLTSNFKFIRDLSERYLTNVKNTSLILWNSEVIKEGSLMTLDYINPVVKITSRVNAIVTGITPKEVFFTYVDNKEVKEYSLHLDDYLPDDYLIDDCPFKNIQVLAY